MITETAGEVVTVVGEDRASRVAPLRQKRWKQLRRWALAAVVVAGVAASVGLFEYTIWHMPVDRFTFVAYNATGKQIVDVDRTNAQEATSLRQQMNALPQPSDNDVRQQDSVVVCSEPIYTGPIDSYLYTFYWQGVQVETVSVENVQCTGGWVSAGGMIYGVTGMPILPKGVHLPPGKPWHP